MNILLIHQNLPGQFREIIKPLIDSGFDVRGIAAHDRELKDHIHCARYTPAKPCRSGIHPLSEEIDDWIRRGTTVAQIIENMIQTGWMPDVILVHPGWGEALFLKDIAPCTPIIIWPELWLNEEHMGHADLSGRNYLRSKNWLLEQALIHCAHAVVPTRYQANTFPEIWRHKLLVVHEGINEALLTRPRLRTLTLPSGVVLDEQTPVLTYISRNLEPLRGFGDLMRTVSGLHQKRTDIHTVVVGGDGSSYSGLHPESKSWKDATLEQLGSSYDPKLVHFVGYLPYDDLVKVMLRSDLNLYLSRSFVLSWSVLEAIACGAPILTYDNKMLLELAETCRDQHPISYVREGDIAKLIEKIEKYISAPSGRAGSGIDNLPRKLPNEWRRSLSSQRIIGLIKQLGASYF